METPEQPLQPRMRGGYCVVLLALPLLAIACHSNNPESHLRSMHRGFFDNPVPVPPQQVDERWCVDVTSHIQGELGRYSAIVVEHCFR